MSTCPICKQPMEHGERGWDGQAHMLTRDCIGASIRATARRCVEIMQEESDNPLGLQRAYRRIRKEFQLEGQ